MRNALVKIVVNYMKIPESLVFQAEDIRHLRHIQLEMLTGIDASNFSAWSNTRGISERNLERIAPRLGMTKGELMKGLDLRRQDAATARASRSKADRLIEFLKS